MAHIIAEPCVGTKNLQCVEVCPTDAIHPLPEEPDFETEKQLYIHPDDCIDCGLCVDACPVQAIFSEDKLPEEWQQYIEINAKYYEGK